MFSKALRPAVMKEDVPLPSCFENKLALLLHVLIEEECENFIAATEKKGYEDSLIHVGFGRQWLMTDVRNNQQCIIDSKEYTDEIWNRIKDFIPPIFKGRKVVGLNERDLICQTDDTVLECNLINCRMRRWFATAAVHRPYELFETMHPDIFHEGSELHDDGRKYTIRTDVMYSSEKMAKEN